MSASSSIASCSAASFVELPVLLEDENRLITLVLSPADAERTSIDPQFLQRLVQDRSEPRCPQIIEVKKHVPLMAATSKKHNKSIDNEASHQNEAPDIGGEAEKDSIFIWNAQCVHLLLSLYEEHEEEFNLGVKRRQSIWEKIALEMEQHGYKISWSQCQTKLNGLKRTYKKILDHNNVSGNDRKNWPYFEKMNEIFGSTGWAQPKMLATDAGPSSTIESNNSEDKTPKKRKLETVLENLNKEMKADQQAAREERETNRKEWNNIKAQKFDELIAQRERQHKEKMKMLELLLESVSKNTNSNV